MRDFSQHPQMRVAALVLCGLGAAARGVAYLHGAPNTALTTFVDTWVPLHVWGLVWVAAGAIMIAGIWHRIVARWGLSIGFGLWGAWSISYYASWLVGDQSRAWVTGSSFLLVAGLMWVVANLADHAGPPPGAVIPDKETVE